MRRASAGGQPHDGIGHQWLNQWWLLCEAMDWNKTNSRNAISCFWPYICITWIRTCTAAARQFPTKFRYKPWPNWNSPSWAQYQWMLYLNLLTSVWSLGRTFHHRHWYHKCTHMSPLELSMAIRNNRLTSSCLPKPVKCICCAFLPDAALARCSTITWQDNFVRLQVFFCNWR